MNKKKQRLYEHIMQNISRNLKQHLLYETNDNQSIVRQIVRFLNIEFDDNVKIQEQTDKSLTIYSEKLSNKIIHTIDTDDNYTELTLDNVIHLSYTEDTCFLYIAFKNSDYRYVQQFNKSIISLPMIFTNDNQVLYPISNISHIFEYIVHLLFDNNQITKTSKNISRRDNLLVNIFTKYSKNNVRYNPLNDDANVHYEVKDNKQTYDVIFYYDMNCIEICSKKMYDTPQMIYDIYLSDSYEEAIKFEDNSDNIIDFINPIVTDILDDLNITYEQILEKQISIKLK